MTTNRSGIDARSIRVHIHAEVTGEGKNIKIPQNKRIETLRFIVICQYDESIFF